MLMRDNMGTAFADPLPLRYLKAIRAINLFFIGCPDKAIGSFIIKITKYIF